jgi:zinc protease
MVEKYVGGWGAPAGPKPDTLLPPVPLNGPSTVSVPDASRVQDKVILAEALGLTRNNPDYYALELGNHVLGGAFFATRLYRDLREHAGLVYDVSSSFEMSRTRGVYFVQYGCDPSNVGKVKAIVERNLKEMREHPVSPDELQRAKALLLREIPLSESSVDSIAEGFIHRTELELPLDEPTLAAKRYLDLSAQEVKEAFEKWVRPTDLVQVSEGPSPE